jgi:hypothetical protein
MIKEDGLPFFERPNDKVPVSNIADDQAAQFRNRPNEELPNEFDCFTFGPSLQQWIGV